MSGTGSLSARVMLVVSQGSVSAGSGGWILRLVRELLGGITAVEAGSSWKWVKALRGKVSEVEQRHVGCPDFSTLPLSVLVSVLLSHVSCC